MEDKKHTKGIEKTEEKVIDKKTSKQEETVKPKKEDTKIEKVGDPLEAELNKEVGNKGSDDAASKVSVKTTGGKPSFEEKTKGPIGDTSKPFSEKAEFQAVTSNDKKEEKDKNPMMTESYKRRMLELAGIKKVIK